MPRSYGFFLLSLLALVFAGGFYGAREISRQRAELARLRTQARLQEQQVTAFRAAANSALERMQQAQTDLNTLQTKAAAEEAARNSPREVEIRSWLGLVKQLKKQFEDSPEQWIPEMRLLTDSDWLGLARSQTQGAEKENRKARAAARDAAKSKFASLGGRALRKLKDASPNWPPASLQEILPYLEPPADAAMLERYEVAPPSKMRTPDDTYVPYNVYTLREKSAIDEAFDARVDFHANGVSSRANPLVWIVEVDRLQEAYAAAMKANNGSRMDDISKIIPFINPPLSAEQTAKLLQADRDKQGQR